METPAEHDGRREREMARIGRFAGHALERTEIAAYIVLGALLAVTAVMGIFGAASALWAALLLHADLDALVVAIDRMLFVLMVVEILHTVGVSFRSGALVAEPFLIVGLIASIRRVLVITLESSQASQPGKWTPETQEQLYATMLELGVLGLLILVMVLSIYLLRRNRPAEYLAP